jgi:putative hydroxymethylpyrimidine transport system ATP-binding protein
MMTQTAISLQNLHLSYNNITLLPNFSLDIRVAEWTCLIGISGVGKSSVLKHIAQLNASDLRVTGNVVFSPGLDHQKIAYMGQKDLLLPWLTTIENILLVEKFTATLKTKAARQKALLLLAELGLTNKADAYPHQLSGGMKQRVALARVLFLDRPIVLMDEPFSALDSVTRHTLQQLVSTKLIGKTVVFITHDPLEAIRLADHIYIVNPTVRGNISKIDLPGKPLREIETPEVASAYKLILTALINQDKLLA